MLRAAACCCYAGHGRTQIASFACPPKPSKRDTGIEPVPPAWKASVLPLYESRTYGIGGENWNNNRYIYPPKP